MPFFRPEPGSPDAALVRRCRESRRDAFEQVVAEHYQRLYRQHYHLCGDRDAAADLTQETFVRAWRALDGFQGRSTLRTWLTTIALRVWQNWSARRPPAASPLDEANWHEWRDPSPPPDALLAERVESEALQAAVLRLPPPQREAVVLFYVLGFTYQEIADAQEVPLGTVKSRLQAGLKRLREQMERAERMEEAV